METTKTFHCANVARLILEKRAIPLLGRAVLRFVHFDGRQRELDVYPPLYPAVSASALHGLSG